MRIANFAVSVSLILLQMACTTVRAASTDGTPYLVREGDATKNMYAYKILLRRPFGIVKDRELVLSEKVPFADGEIDGAAIRADADESRYLCSHADRSEFGLYNLPQRALALERGEHPTSERIILGNHPLVVAIAAAEQSGIAPGYDIVGDDSCPLPSGITLAGPRELDERIRILLVETDPDGEYGDGKNNNRAVPGRIVELPQNMTVRDVFRDWKSIIGDSK